MPGLADTKQGLGSVGQRCRAGCRQHIPSSVLCPQSTRSGGSPAAGTVAPAGSKSSSAARGARCATARGTSWRRACCAARWAAASPSGNSPSATRCPARCSTSAGASSRRWPTASGPTTNRLPATSPGRSAWSATVRDPSCPAPRVRGADRLFAAMAGGGPPAERAATRLLLAPHPCRPPARLPGLADANPDGRGDAEQRHAPRR